MEAIRQQYGLTALRLGYARQGAEEGGRGARPQASVTCSLRAAGADNDDWAFPASGIGLLSGSTTPDSGIVDGVRSCREFLQRNASVATLQEQHAPLWLAVTPEHPLLPGVDWERGLAGLGVPVLRLPGQLSTAPTTAPPQPRIAICVSMPRAKAAFEAVRLVRAAIDSIGVAHTGPAHTPGATGPEVHLFADADMTGQLTSEFGDRAIVHDPEQEGPHEPAQRTSSADPGSDPQPWLAWIQHAVGARLDVLHLIGHGFLSGGQGAFAVAEAPDKNYDRRTARFIWPQQIAALMTVTGAWGLVVSAAPRNYSAAGLRLFSGQVSALRSAATGFHDPDPAVGPGGPGALGRVYELLLHYPAAPPPSTEGLTLIMHPGRFGVGYEPSSSYQPAPTSLGGWVDSGEDLPAWMVGAQRQVAQWESQLTFDSDSGEAESTRAGLEVAKSRLDAVMRQARESGTTS